MIAKVGTFLQKIRWFLDPNRWMIRLLGLSKFEEIQKSPGLVFIQIDGLSHQNFQQASQRGYLPFLKRLKAQDGYALWHHYSGVPSSTPAIQAELFYGKKQLVPAFKFLDHKSREMFTFYNTSTATTVEDRLNNDHSGLLGGGSSYSNIYTGGAKENAHFCVSTIGWRAFFNAMNPYSLAVFFLFNLISIFRTIFYLAVEFILAVFDSIRGGLRGYGWREEIQFIISRLMVTIILRELTTLAVRLDLARGLPVIHVNFFGYDDQAHRRGASSRFAYWALPGIDASIKRIWKTAQNTLTRDYDVWIYSDHGQEEVAPYPVLYGIKVETAVENLFREMMPAEDLRSLRVAAQGPVGFVYAHRKLQDAEKEKMAKSLVEKINIPMVLIKTEEKKVYALTQTGKFSLPEDAADILGEDHPYLQEAREELKDLCLHPDSGDFLISGWQKDGKPVTFPHEYGSHAGPGPNETDGMALLPRGIRFNTSGRNYLRPALLRETALGFLAGNDKVFYGADPLRRVRQTLRIMTYNVHSCRGMDGKLSPERIARVIARHDPDIIALQELDSGRARSQGMDQAKMIAKLLDMEHHFHSVHTVKEEKFGNAVLSRFPLKLVRAGSLPRYSEHNYFEPRGVLWVEIQCFNTSLYLMNTHLSFWKQEQKKQAAALCGIDWLGSKTCEGHTVLCGDLNALPQSPACRSVREKLEDVQLKATKHKPLKTWTGHFPLGRIDHIFVSPQIEVLKVEVPSSRLEKLASDHLPLIAEIRIPEK